MLLLLVSLTCCIANFNTITDAQVAETVANMLRVADEKVSSAKTPVHLSSLLEERLSPGMHWLENRELFVSRRLLRRLLLLLLSLCCISVSAP